MGERADDWNMDLVLSASLKSGPSGTDVAQQNYSFAWDIPGACDIPVMTAAINAHVRRHDTYHSWFEFEDGVIVRHVIEHSLKEAA